MILFDLSMRLLGKMISKWVINILLDPGKIQFLVPIPWFCFSGDVGVEICRNRKYVIMCHLLINAGHKDVFGCASSF